MSVRGSLVGVVVIGLLAGCYLVIEPPPPPEKVEVLVPYPVEVPVPVPGGGAGSGGTGGERPSTLDSGGLLVLWMVRIDVAAAMLAEQYQSQVARLRAALEGAGLPIEAEVLVSIYDGQPLWARSWDVPAPVSVAAALRFYGERQPVPIYGCTTTSLAVIGGALDRLSVTYPDELMDPSSSPDGDPTSGGTVIHSHQVLQRAPGGVLVMFIDSGPRPNEVTAAPCWTTYGDPLAYFGGYSPAAWVRFGPKQYLRSQTKFGFIATPEQVESQQWLEQCLRNADFPRPALDAISASTHPFFDPMNQFMQPVSRRYDFCEAVTDGWDVTAFVQEFRSALDQVSP